MAVINLHRFGKYEIIEELGRGGMGVVYKARDPIIGRLVALKTLTGESAADPDLMKRFEREAQAAGRLQHPNIVTIYDIGDAGGTPFIAMEFLDGENLEKIIARREPMPLAHKLNILLQFCRGLGYAHQHDVVHRDIKPANIFVKSDGTVKILDFGIVHISATSMTQTGMVIGTIPYMSPEQVSGQHIDQRSDIFSVGTVAYEFVIGTRPFDGPNMPSIMLKIVQGRPAPPSALLPDLPPVLEQAIMRCLEPQPDRRFQSLDDLVLELEPLEQSLKRQTIGELVGRGQALYERKEYSKAREVLRNVLVLDSSHDQAKGLMAKIVTEMRRQEVASRVARLVGEGDALLGEGKNAEAGRALEEAVKLDSGHAQARNLLEEARKRMEREKRVGEHLSAIQAALGKGNLTVAEASLSKLLELDAGNHEAQVFEERIKQGRAHERGLRMQQALLFPRHLLVQENFEEAAQQLEQLQREFPGDGEIEELLGTARRKLTEQQQRRELEADVTAIQGLIRSENYQTAVERAQVLRNQNPDSHEASRLLEFARGLHQTAEQQKEVAGLRHEIQLLLDAKRYQEAVRNAEGAVKRFPDSRALCNLLEVAREGQAGEAERREQESARQRVAQEISTIEKLLAVKDYATALDRAESLDRQYPDRPEVRRLLDLVRATRRAAENKQVAAYCQAIQTSLDAGEAERACEEAERALRYFPGNVDLVALLMAARRTLSERIARREPMPGDASSSPHLPARATEPGSEVDPSATAMFQPGRGKPEPVTSDEAQNRGADVVFERTQAGPAEDEMRTGRQQAPDAFAPEPIAAAGPDNAGEAAPSDLLERLRSRQMLVPLVLGVVAILVVAGIVIRHRRRSRPLPPSPPSTIEVTVTTVPAGAEVQIDGQDKGQSPLPTLMLEPGSHPLEITKEGYQKLSHNLDVGTGSETSPAFVLTPLPLNLQLFTSNLRHPTIQYDGSPSGGMGRDNWGIEVTGQGSHTIEISSKGPTASLGFTTEPGLIPTIDGRLKTTNNGELVTVSSLGSHAVIQFSFTPTKVTLDDQTYEVKPGGIDVSSLGTTPHTLIWKEASAPEVRRQFESGRNPELIVFLIPGTVAGAIAKVSKPQPGPPPPVGENAQNQESDALATQAYDASTKGRYIDAIRYAKQALDKNKSNAYATAQLNFARGQYEEAIKGAAASKNFDNADHMVQALISLLPDDPTIKDLKNQISQDEQAEKAKNQPVVVQKPAFTAEVRYGKTKVPGTLTIGEGHLRFSAGAGTLVDLLCSDISAVNPKGRFLDIGQRGFRVITKSRKTYEFLSSRTTSGEVLSACKK